MQTSMKDARSISPMRAYKVAEIADCQQSGTAQVYADIKAGRLRAAKLNDRGDLRILGAWYIEYLESRAGGGDGSAKR
jgi:hypothetical protein